ncbi:hypothetical protein IWX77_002984 [Cryobacterium sp. CAN_C2]
MRLSEVSFLLGPSFEGDALVVPVCFAWSSSETTSIHPRRTVLLCLPDVVARA